VASPLRIISLGCATSRCSSSDVCGPTGSYFSVNRKRERRILPTKTQSGRGEALKRLDVMGIH
jgi:hypothetical protein